MHFSFEINSILIIFLLLIVNQLTYVKPNATPEKPNEESIVPEDMPEEDLSEFNDNGSEQVLDTGTSKLSPSALSEYMKEHPEVKQITTGGKRTKTKRVYNKFGDVVTITVTEPTSEQKSKSDPKEQTNNSQISQGMPPYPYPYYNPYQYYAFGQPGQPMMAMNDPRFAPPEGGKPMTQEEMAQYQSRFINANNGSYPPGMPPMMPYPQPYPPFHPLFGPNQYRIDGKNVQIMPMPYPNGVGMDPNLLKQLESGRAQLDVANAQIVPIDTETTTEKSETPGTESETLDDRPELPEVIFPKEVVTTKKPKHRRHPRRKHKHGLKKPHFLMRARLNNLPKKNQNGTDQWWTKPVPKYCKDSIVEIVNCKHKKLEKRWSFNKEDEKCYLYEDLCHSVKKNTFKSLKECMTTCWRPK